MSRKFYSILLILFSIVQFFGQTSDELYYEELPEHSFKKASITILASKMLDSIGHKYFWTTDSLIQKGLEISFQSDNTPRIFLKGMHILTLKMIDLTQKNVIGYIQEPKTFKELRNETLLNIKTISDYFLTNEEAIVNIDWIIFFNLIDNMRQYGDTILEYRKSIGLPLNPIFDKKRENKSAIETFEEQLGADGLSNKQWMTIMEAGGGPIAHAKMSRQSRANKVIISEMKKLKIAKVNVGKLEEIKPYSRTIEDIKYTYYSQQSPKQLSFVYDSNLNLLSGLTDWIISINAGRQANLSEIFRIGIKNKLHLYEKDILGPSASSRKIMNNESNSILIKIDKRYIDKDMFWDIPINEVRIMGDNIIKFIRQSPSENPYGNREVVVLSIINIDGTLLKRYKDLIKASRNGSIDINISTLRLK